MSGEAYFRWSCCCPHTGEGDLGRRSQRHSGYTVYDILVQTQVGTYITAKECVGHESRTSKLLAVGAVAHGIGKRISNNGEAHFPEMNDAPRTDKTIKRHTYNELGSSQARPNPWNRIVSLPPTGQSPGPARSTPLQMQIPTPPLQVSDKAPLGRPRRLQNLDPRPLLRALDALLDPKTQRIPDFLDVDYIIALHERDVMERDQRDVIKIRARMDRAHNRFVSNGLTVFGSSLREATMYASLVTVLGGHEHDLPIVVFRCVNELCRHGFNNSQRQQKPHRDRLLALISAFDSEPQFGATTPLNSPNELPEIYGLLSTYVFALPEPVLSSEMFEAIWTWCIVPTLRSTDFMEEKDKPRRHATSDTGILIVQILLRLLPLPNLSLIVYMMGFFQRLPHLITEDIGRAIFAGTFAKTSPVSDGRVERAETMLRWFLDRWDTIFKALFPPLEAKHGENDVSPAEKPWTPSSEPASAPSTALREARADAEAVSSAEPTGGSDSFINRRDPLMRLPSEGLFEKANEVESDASSISSSCAIGERLLDVTAEFAQDAQAETERRNRQMGYCGRSEEFSGNKSDGGDSGYQSPEENREAPCSPCPPEEPSEEEMSHAKALRRISLLERELERSDVAVADAIDKTFRAQDQVKELETKLRAYEKDAGKAPPKLELTLDKRAADDWHAVLHSDTEALKKQLAETQKERDAALQLIQEMKRLMKAHAYSLY
ncbi:hypothetical protein GGX14DRAFT_539860 [Mycena pura]|uniref:Rho-GAP domain-containing protein n=1 Tax=Mycena pura TaxID=153505 RepID=A0AAD6YMV5_9AGAR|nr:hypothetical protein GGX14DRAFT_539860 [Mycena pura]